MKKIIKGFKNIISNPRYFIIYLNHFGLLNFINDVNYQKLMYWANTNKKLNLDNPKGFNEKLKWLMIHDKNPLYTQLVDKYKVREYVTEKIGEQYLIPLISIYSKPEDIDFSILPDKFVLKCNHNSGEGMCICKNKNTLDYDLVKNKLSKGLHSNGYMIAREWPYKNVVPLVVCEKYMEDELSKSMGIDGLLDYKFYCFNGVPKFLYVSLTEKDKGKKSNMNYYDMDFNRTPFVRPDHNSLSFDVQKPICFDEMKRIAESLSKDIPFVRVDLYQINGKVYFGELTLYPGAGHGIFSPEEWELKLGDWLDISHI